MILNIISFAFLLGFIGYITSLLFFGQNVNEWIIFWSIVFVMSLGLSIMKWNYTMRIIRIKTIKSKSENRQIIERFVDENGFQYRFHNNDFIQTVTKSGFLWLRMELNFIIRENEIFINVNYYDAHANWPSFFKVKRFKNEIIKQ